MSFNSLFTHDVEQLSQRYTFDGLYAADYLKMFLSDKHTESDKNYLTNRILYNYIECCKGEILHDLIIYNRSMESFIADLETGFNIKDRETQKMITDRLNQDIGTFMRSVIGRGVSYLTHDVDVNIDTRFSIFVKVAPSFSSPVEKYSRMLDMVEESGGWVSRSERERIENALDENSSF